MKDNMFYNIFSTFYLDCINNLAYICIMKPKITKKMDINKTMSYNISIDVYEKIIAYIEWTEEYLDGEFGKGNSVAQLMKLNKMPELYLKLLKIKTTDNEPKE